MIIFKKEKNAIQKYKDYIEGKTDFDLFWKDYISCKYLMKYLKKTAHRKNIGCVDEYYFSLIQRKKKTLIFIQNICYKDQFVVI